MTFLLQLLVIGAGELLAYMLAYALWLRVSEWLPWTAAGYEEARWRWYFKSWAEEIRLSEYLARRRKTGT